MLVSIGMQTLTGPGISNGAFNQGAKHGLTDESLQAPNKAAWLESTIGENISGVNIQISGNYQSQGHDLYPVRVFNSERPAVLQSASQLLNSTAPAILGHGIMRTNEQSNGTPSLDNPGSLGGQSSLQAHPEVRDVPSGSTVDPRPSQAGPSQAGPYSGSAVCSQVPVYANTTQGNIPIYQSDPSLRLASYPQPLPPQFVALLYDQYADLRDSQQAHITFEAADNIRKIVESIAEQVRPNSLCVTKHHAMCALRNIGMMVLEGNDFLGAGIRKYMAYNGAFVEAMQSL
ncbi:hypothetical protein KCU61_g3729, partial [Aureobasidium melanogenum]